MKQKPPHTCSIKLEILSKGLSVLSNTMGLEPTVAINTVEQDAQQNLWEKTLTSQTSGRRLVCDCWEFYAPNCASEPVVIDVSKILRESASALYWHDESQHDGLRLLGERMTQLRSLFVTQPHLLYNSQQEEHLLLYLSLLSMVRRHFENNTGPFVYTLPNGGGTVRSDSFTLEYLVTLQMLLSNYYKRASQPANGESYKERRVHYDHCVDLLQEMQGCVSETLDRRSSWAQALIRYVKSPSNISSASLQQQQYSPPQQPQYIELQQLLLQHWGGTAGIEARLHLCRAKSNEMCFSDYYYEKHKGVCGLLDSDAFHEALIPLMESVRREYAQVAECMGKRSTECDLFCHARVMNYYWRCQIQHMLAAYEAQPFLLQQQPNDLLLLSLPPLPTLESLEETERKVAERLAAKRAFARTDDIRQKHDSFVSNMRTFVLDSALKQKYDRLIKTALELDVQLHDKLGHPDGGGENPLAQELRPYVFQQRTKGFFGALDELVKPQLQSNKALRRVCQFVQTLHEIPLLATPTTTTTGEYMATTQDADPRLSNEFKRGMVEERRYWMRWFQTHYDAQKSVLKLEEFEPSASSSKDIVPDDRTLGRLQERAAFLEWLVFQGGVHRQQQMRIDATQVTQFTEELRLAEKVHATLHVNNKFI
jgi:hypothetical protein